MLAAGNLKGYSRDINCTWSYGLARRLGQGPLVWDGAKLPFFSSTCASKPTRANPATNTSISRTSLFRMNTTPVFAI